MKISLTVSIVFGGSLLFATGCVPARQASIAHDASIARDAQGLMGPPRIAVHGAIIAHHAWKRVSLAIAEYNLSKGRKLDLATPNELVLYEAIPSPDGGEQVTSKTVYDYTIFPDSIIITSHRYRTSDLDDTTVTEADDPASCNAEQQELAEIAERIEQASPTMLPQGHEGLAVPDPSR